MNILVIRTDNIGDLVCTTPLLVALRARYPVAWIGVLTNSYSAPVLLGNSSIDEVLVYQKAKHLDDGDSVLRSYWRRLKTVLGLRRRGIDLVLLPAVAKQPSALRFARWIGARQVIANVDSGHPHEVEKVYALLARQPGGVDGQDIPGCMVKPDGERVAKLRNDLGLPENGGRLRVGVHISARKPSQRWPAAAFVEFIRAQAARRNADFLLFWSPGCEDDPRHPGDDKKAAEIIAGTAGLPVFPIPTASLPELISGLALCDVVLQSDGGAMHLAAALGKPILCFFGQSDASRWHPWGVPYELLQPENRDVSTIDVAEVLAAFERLLSRLSSAAS